MNTPQIVLNTVMADLDYAIANLQRLVEQKVISQIEIMDTVNSIRNLQVQLLESK